MPDERRERSAEHRLAIEVGGHRHEAVRVSDPDGDRVLVVPADEPRVAVVRRGAGLAGGELADSGGSSGAVLEHTFEHRGLGGGDFGRQHVSGGHVVHVAMGAVGQQARAGVDLLDRDRPVVFCQRPAHASSAVGDRLIGVGHVERGDADGEPADGHRRVGGERRGDPHPMGHVGDAMGADLQADFGVDRVVGVGGRAGERVGPRVGAFVVVHDESFRAARAVKDEHLLL